MTIGIIRGTKKDNSRRLFPGVGGSRHNPTTIKTKRAEAKVRQEAWARLSPQEQLDALDVRLGTGVGATRQRARIIARLKAKAAKPTKDETSTVQPTPSGKDAKNKGDAKGHRRKND